MKDFIIIFERYLKDSNSTGINFEPVKIFEDTYYRLSSNWFVTYKNRGTWEEYFTDLSSSSQELIIESVKKSIEKFYKNSYILGNT